MVERNSVSRSVPTRSVPQRFGRSSSRQSGISTQTSRSRKEAERSTILSNIAKSVKSFVGTISNINDLDNSIQVYYSQNVSNIPADLQGDFKSLIQTERNNLVGQQNQLKARLENSVKVYKQREEYYSSKDNYAIADKYYAQLNEARKQLSSVNSGNISNVSDTYSKITSVGRAAQKEKEFRLSKGTSAINKYVGSAYKFKLESVKDIQSRFDVSLSKAKEIRKEIQNKQVEFTSGEALQINKGIDSREKVLSLREKTLKQVDKFSKNVDNDYYSKYINTNASFPPNVQKYRSVFLNELTTKQISNFNQLNTDAKGIIVNYSLLKNIKSAILSNVTSDKDIQEVFRGKDTAQSRSKLSYVFETRIIENDIKNLKRIINLNDKSLLNLSKSKDIDKVEVLANNSIRSLNKFVTKREKVKNVLTQELLYLVRKNQRDLISDNEVKSRLVSIIKNYPKGAKTLDEIKDKGFFKAFLNELNRNIKTIKAVPFKGRPDKFIRYSVLTALSTDLNNKIKQGKNISIEDYKFWKKSLNDFTGLKEFSKTEIRRLQQDFGKEKANTILKAAVTIGLVLVEAGKIAVNDIAGLLVNTDVVNWKNIKSVITGKKKVGKITVAKLQNALGVFTKFGFKIGRGLSDDSFLLGEVLANKLTASEKKEVRFNTIEVVRNLYKTGMSVKEFANKLKENPELITLGIAVGLVSLVKFNKKALTKNPKEYFAQLASYFIDDVLIQGGIKAFKITKRLFSPFVLRNINVFEKGATKITTAQALKFIEGKSVDLFSASPNKIKELFTGADIGKKDLSDLIKSMLKNPNLYLDKNKKIKKIDTLIKSKVQRDILEFAKTNDAILTGSGSLKLQLKDFRKVGDFDLIVKNPKSFGKKLVTKLNDETILGKISKYKRYELKQNKAVSEVYFVYDRLTKKKLVDLDDFGLISKNFESNLGRKLGSSDLIKVNGVTVLKVESQLPLKLSLSKKTTSSFRAAKELKDVGLIVKKNKNKLNSKNFETLKRILNNNDNVLSVKGSLSGLGKDRKFFWAKKYGINTDKLSETQIVARLKKYGLSTAMINKNIDLYSSDGFYFGIDKVYSYFLSGKRGAIVHVKDFKIDRYPKNIQRLLKKNIEGKLGNKEKLNLRKLINRYIKNNPDKVLLGEKPLVDLIGEEEAIAAVFTRLYPKKKLVTREVYIPILDNFVKIQEAVIGKKPLSIVKDLYNKLVTKMKKGYKVADMKKDIINWAKKNISNFKEEVKSVVTSVKQRKDFVKQQTKLLDDEVAAIEKLDIPNSQKDDLVRTLKRNTRRILKNTDDDITKLLRDVRRVVNSNRVRVRKVLNVRKVKIPARFRTEGRRVKKVIRKVKKVARKTKRVVRKLKAPRKVPRITKKPRAIARTPKSPRKIVRTPRKVTRLPKPIKKIERITKIPKLPRFKLNWDTDIPRGYKRIVNGYALVNQRRVKVVSNMPENKAWNKVFSKGTKKYRSIDKSIAQSFEFDLIGIAKRKDDSRKIGVFKTRTKKSKGSKVLQVVELRRYALDSVGEVKQLKVRKTSASAKNGKKKEIKKKSKAIKKASQTKRKSSSAIKKSSKSAKKSKSKVKRKKTISNKRKARKKK